MQAKLLCAQLRVKMNGPRGRHVTVTFITKPDLIESPNPLQMAEHRVKEMEILHKTNLVFLLPIQLFVRHFLRDVNFLPNVTTDFHVQKIDV